MAKEKKANPEEPEDNKFFAYDGSMETYPAKPITAEDLEELAILKGMLSPGETPQAKPAPRKAKK